MNSSAFNDVGQFQQMRIDLAVSFMGDLPNDSVELVPLPVSMVYFDIYCTYKAE